MNHLLNHFHIQFFLNHFHKIDHFPLIPTGFCTIWAIPFITSLLRRRCSCRLWCSEVVKHSSNRSESTGNGTFNMNKLMCLTMLVKYAGWNQRRMIHYIDLTVHRQFMILTILVKCAVNSDKNDQVVQNLNGLWTVRIEYSSMFHSEQVVRNLSFFISKLSVFDRYLSDNCSGTIFPSTVFLFVK